MATDLEDFTYGMIWGLLAGAYGMIISFFLTLKTSYVFAGAGLDFAALSLVPLFAYIHFRKKRFIKFLVG